MSSRKRTRAPAVRRPGRPLTPVNPQVVEGMARVGATNREIADFTGLHESNVGRRFARILTKARSQMRLRLRQAQYQAAVGQPPTAAQLDPAGNVLVPGAPGVPSNPTMLIWMGKQLLKQSDKAFVEVRDWDALTPAQLAAIAEGNDPFDATGS